MSTLNNVGIKYHKGMKLVLLGKKDHAIIFRGTKDGVDVNADIGVTKKDINEGGILVGTVTSNLFRQEFVDQLVAQINYQLQIKPDHE
jgi:hypothetical protein